MSKIKEITPLPDLEYYKRLSELQDDYIAISLLPASIRMEIPDEARTWLDLREFQNNFIPQSALKEALRDKK